MLMTVRSEKETVTNINVYSNLLLKIQQLTAVVTTEKGGKTVTNRKIYSNLLLK